MGSVTIIFGVVLIALGSVGFVSTGSEHPTALIPAFLGLALATCGVVALKDNLRMHAMHGAVLLGLVGCLGGLFMVVRTLLKSEIERPVAFAMNIAMAVTCGVFVGLCVKSFIEARRRRKQNAALSGEMAAPKV